jgi:hypothetical protein
MGKAQSVAAAALCAAGGLAAGMVAGGGRLVRIFDWTTEWTVDAPRAEVFALFQHPEEQVRWWPSMIVEHASPAGVSPRTVIYRVVQAPSVRRFAPPFRIIAVQSDADEPGRIRAVVSGDLAGVLDTLLYDTPGAGTRVVFHWYVRVCNPLLNLAGYFAAPVFRASHDHVMREGEAGLRAYFALPAGERNHADATADAAAHAPRVAE